MPCIRLSGPWILEVHPFAEDCLNRLQRINRPCMQRERDKACSLLEPAELRHESICQSDCQDGFDRIRGVRPVQKDGQIRREFKWSNCFRGR